MAAPKRKSTRKTKAPIRQRVLTVYRAPYAPTKYCTLKFATLANLITTTVLLPYNISANGCNDPDLSSVSTLKPMYFTDLAGVYDQYTVISSKLVVKVFPATLGQYSALITAFLNDDTTVVPTNFAQVSQNANGLAVYPMCAGATTPTTFTMTYSAATEHGPGFLGNDGLNGTTTGSTNPTEATVYTIVQESSNGSSSASYYYSISVEYYVQFSELKDRQV